MRKSPKFSPEVIERAVRMVFCVFRLVAGAIPR